MILGIDTSCYTTSIAVTDEQKKLVFEKRQILQVSEGERGLQQSKALFQHLNNFPQLIEAAFNSLKPGDIRAICVSSRPRSVEGSYMPVFTAGVNYAQVLAYALGIPLFTTSHQEGHIEAGIWSADNDKKCENKLKNEFIAVHLSGGTSEILKVSPLDSGYNIEKLGGSLDLHAGQFVDRVGVNLGLSFPAGSALEKLAQTSTGTLRIPSSVTGLNISFSGPETMAQRLIVAGEKKEDVARAVEHTITVTIEKVVRKVVENYNLKDILIVGGVAANQYLRRRLRERLEHRAVGARIYFAEPNFSTDNSVGVSLLGWKMLNKQ